LLGVLGFLRLMFHDPIMSQGQDVRYTVATVIGISLIFIVMAGTIAGSMLPLLMKKLGFDPAASSAPFVATFSDVMGILIYFTIATVFLKGMLF
jgi:magnesium transporter